MQLMLTGQVASDGVSHWHQLWNWGFPTHFQASCPRLYVDTLQGVAADNPPNLSLRPSPSSWTKHRVWRPCASTNQSPATWFTGPLDPHHRSNCVGVLSDPPSLSHLIPASRFLSPEFIPPRQRTNPIKFSIERKDMIRRRKVLNIPEFYVGKKRMQILSLVETKKEKKKNSRSIKVTKSSQKNPNTF